MDYCCKRGMSLKYKTARKIENSEINFENPAHNTDFLGASKFRGKFPAYGQGHPAILATRTADQISSTQELAY